MNLAGELVLGRNQLLMLSDRIKEDIAGFGPALRNIDRVATGLRDKVMSTRLQPLGQLFGRYPRILHDLAQSLGKQIELTITGQDVELDKSLIELLSDPLTHLMRNCADHGIESPAEREAVGKPSTGRVALSASHQGGRVFIRITDDGRGIDVERVRRKIVERGLAREEEAAAMSARQALRHIFMPGFSTAEAITHVSGRGVGMDVVKNNIEKVGGSVDLDSRLGQGTTVTLSLPLTVAVVPAMIAGVRDRVFAIPQAQLEELVSLKTSGIPVESVRGAPVIRLRERLLPLVDLARLLRLDDLPSESFVTDSAGIRRSPYVLVIKSNQDRYGLLVDHLMDEEEIVVKPLSAHLANCPCYSGSTILGDGRIVLILDTSGIVDFTGLSFIEENNEQAARLQEEQRRRATETQHLLLFRNAAQDLFAVNQELIARIEKISPDCIETVAARQFITHNGQALRLIRLEEYLPVAEPSPPPDHYYLLIPKLVKKPMGILCSSVEDAVDVNVALDRQSVQGPGIMGTAVLEQGLAIILDIYSLFEAADPEAYNWKKTRNRLQGLHFLLVDDTLFFRTLVSQYLESLNCEVDVAQDGIQAWEMLNRGQYDALITDLEMPGMDGFELTSHVRTSAKLRSLPVIALSSISKTRYLDKALAAGVDAYESKVDKDQLRTTIERVLREKGASLSPAAPPHENMELPMLDPLHDLATEEVWSS